MHVERVGALLMVKYISWFAHNSDCGAFQRMQSKDPCILQQQAEGGRQQNIATVSGINGIGHVMAYVRLDVCQYLVLFVLYTNIAAQTQAVVTTFEQLQKRLIVRAVSISKVIAVCDVTHDRGLFLNVCSIIGGDVLQQQIGANSPIHVCRLLLGAM